MLRFAPHYVPAPWGGRRLSEDFERVIPEGPIGEAWELVDLGESQSRVADGPARGKSLSELWQSGSLGGSASGAFPFLLKWLDSRGWLSVQVHPDEEACTRLGSGAPKTEAWYVAQSAPGSVMLLGHYPGLDPATLRQAAAGGTIRKWLYEVSPRAGDMLLVPAGTLHAIGPGYLLLEVQQPSDTTFRVYDWGRVGLDGTPRPLHIDEAVAAVAFARPGAPKATRQPLVGPCFSLRPVKAGTEIAAGQLTVLVSDSGASVQTARAEVVLRPGDVAVAERDDGLLQIKAGTCVLLSEPPASR